MRKSLTTPLCRPLLGALLLGLLTACSDEAGLPPEVAITAPVAGTPLTGTVAIQVAVTSENDIDKVEAYARERGSKSKGLLLGSTAAKPYVVSWYTANVPNLSALEIYALATDETGTEGASDPVNITVANAGAPNLAYFAGFNLPGGYQANAARAASARREIPQLPERVLPPEYPPTAAAPSDTRRALADTERTYAVEWAWEPQPGARGYNIFQGQGDLTGPYTKERGQLPDGTNGLQKYSVLLDRPDAAQRRLGAVTVLSQTGESGLSNVGAARFLAAQPGGEASNLVGGKPSLSWERSPDANATGYLYFVYKQNPLESGDAPVWTNTGGRTITDTRVDYPTGREKLANGTYYWWVAAVSFTPEGRPSGFSFSAPQQLVIR